MPRAVAGSRPPHEARVLPRRRPPLACRLGHPGPECVTLSRPPPLLVAADPSSTAPLATLNEHTVTRVCVEKFEFRACAQRGDPRAGEAGPPAARPQWRMTVPPAEQSLPKCVSSHTNGTTPC